MQVLGIPKMSGKAHSELTGWRAGGFVCFLAGQGRGGMGHACSVHKGMWLGDWQGSRTPAVEVVGMCGASSWSSGRLRSTCALHLTSVVV